MKLCIKKYVYILYHAPHICMNKLEISFSCIQSWCHSNVEPQGDWIFLRWCFILHGVKIQGTIIWRNLKLNLGFTKEALFDQCGPKLIWAKDLVQKYIYIQKVNLNSFIKLVWNIFNMVARKMYNIKFGSETFNGHTQSDVKRYKFLSWLKFYK